MKILFYLPMVVPWWFNNIIAPMLYNLHGTAELHVMVPPLWRGTGIEGEHLESLLECDQINWHIIDSDDPEMVRLNGAEVDGLLDLVHQIDPDLTIARSADIRTPAMFPGLVRFIMEGAAPPFQTNMRWAVLDERPFCHGVIPDHAWDIGERCADALGDLWRVSEQRLGPDADNWRDTLGLPHGRPIVAVPLLYARDDNFFLSHTPFPDAAELIAHLLNRLDKDVFLAISDHPMNRFVVNREEVYELIASNPDRTALCQADMLPLRATGLLAAKADAMLIDLSKTWSLAARFNTPMLHIGATPIADWLNATTDLRTPFATLPSADPEAMRRWFGWHLAARLIEPRQITADTLMRHALAQPDDEIIAGNLERLHDCLSYTA